MEAQKINNRVERLVGYRRMKVKCDVEDPTIETKNAGVAFFELSKNWKNGFDSVKEFRILGLDKNNRVICRVSIAIESNDDSLLKILGAFKNQIQEKGLHCEKIFLGENSLFGLLTPSPRQNALAKEFRSQAKIAGIEVKDHLIMDKNSCYSFVENDYKVHNYARSR